MTKDHILFALWAICLVGGAISSLVYRKKEEANLTSGIVGILSTFTLVAFVLVFIVGRSSNVAQFAGKAGLDWWSFWFKIWGINAIGSLILGLIGAVTLFWKPRPTRDAVSFSLRVVVLAGILLSLYHTFRFMPDA